MNTRSDSVTLTSLAAAPRWVGWRNEARQGDGGSGDTTKVPYNPKTGDKAHADKPWTWRPLREAEAWARRCVNGHGGGVGIELGVVGDGVALGGVDLDACRSADGTVEPWAREVIDRLGTYAEVSPSGDGVKCFFRFDAESLDNLLGLMGPSVKSGRKWAPNPGKHTASIELYLTARYFTVTRQRLPDAPDELRFVDNDTLSWIVQDAGPTFKRAGERERAKRASARAPRRGGDNTRSSRAFVAGVNLRRGGASFEEMCAALLGHEDDEIRSWAREKGRAGGGREFRRIWDKGNDPAWLADAQKNDEGAPLSNLANALLALREAPELKGLFGYDEMQHRTILLSQLPERHIGACPRAVTDGDVTAIQEWLQRAGLTRISSDVTHQALDRVAEENAFHPVRDYLNGIEWDGVERLPTWLHDYLGAERSDYTAAVGRMFLVSMVARVMRPGCKADYMMVLESPQGEEKSKACATLGGSWFSDCLPDIRNGTHAIDHLPGRWLIEVDEMSAMSKADASALKAFLTRATDRYRPAYARKEVTRERQCVFIGTTNKAQYLRDETGNRRFWPVRVGSIRVDDLRRDRDQLFAEALARYRADEPWWPTRDFERQTIRPEQDTRFEDDVWTEPVAEFVSTREDVTPREIARDGLKLEVEKLGTQDSRRISAILGHLGWVPGPRTATRKPWIRGPHAQPLRDEASADPLGDFMEEPPSPRPATPGRRARATVHPLGDDIFDSLDDV